MSAFRLLYQTVNRMTLFSKSGSYFRTVPNIIFLDEAQRLPRLTRRFIWQRAKTWVIASHENHCSELEQAGFRVQLIQLTGLSVSKLEAIIEQRLEWARRAEGEIPRIPRQRLEQLLETHGDDLRSIEGALYDEYQKLSVIKP
jgi:replication-associated recombination protein RarA